MKHLSQEDLILYYYGEQETAAEHLQDCESCRRGYQALQRTLNAVDSFPVPERAADYELRVWQSVSARLGARPRRRWWMLPRWSMAVAMATLLLGAFFAGRWVHHPAASAPPAAAAHPERILLVAVGDHLERAQFVLAELSNAGSPGKGKLDISYEQQTAEDLVEANRLYRQTADDAGDRATAAMLDDVERVLLEITHSPAQVSRSQLKDLRGAIQDAGLQFKVRVFQTQIQERDKSI